MFTAHKKFDCWSSTSVRGTWKFQEVFHAGGPVQIRALQDLAFQIQADSPSNIMFTSGTTATPKAVVLSHFSLINNVALTGKRLMLWDESVILNVPASLTHTVGLCVASLGPIVCGYTSVFPSTLFTPAAVAESIQDEKCTALVGTPTMIVDLFFFSDFNKYDLSSLRFVVSGAAAIPVDVAIAVSTKINKPILTGYGSTESTCTVLLPKITDSLAKQSVKGLPLDLTEVKIVDTEGKIVPRGVNGELLVRGYCLMKEYWQESAKTRNVITKDGWYKTGDVAVMDELDYVQIVGRLHEMINRGGDNINPRDIEEFLSFHPNISAVQVFGVPDKRFGEVVCAWIIPKPNMTLTFEDIKNYCKGQIAHFKIPKYIVFVDEFPRTSTGKIQKYIMQEETLLKFSLRN